MRKSKRVKNLRFFDIEKKYIFNLSNYQKLKISKNKVNLRIKKKDREDLYRRYQNQSQYDKNPRICLRNSFYLKKKGISGKKANRSRSKGRQSRFATRSPFRKAENAEITQNYSAVKGGRQGLSFRVESTSQFVDFQGMK